MMRLTMLIAVLLLPVLAGCESSTSLLYANPSLTGTKEGQQCLSPDPVGFGRMVDLTGHEAMRLGGITQVRTVEYRVSKFHGWGKECVVARGE